MSWKRLRTILQNAHFLLSDDFYCVDCICIYIQIVCIDFARNAREFIDFAQNAREFIDFSQHAREYYILISHHMQGN